MWAFLFIINKCEKPASLFSDIASHLGLHLAGIQRFGTPGMNTLAHLGGYSPAVAHSVGDVLSQVRKMPHTWSDIHLIIIDLLFQAR